MKKTKRLIAALAALTLAASMTAFAADKTVQVPNVDEYGEHPAQLGVWFTGVNGTQDVLAEWGGGSEGGLYTSIAVAMQTGGTLTVPAAAQLSINQYSFTLTRNSFGDDVLNRGDDWMYPRCEIGGKLSVGDVNQLEVAKGTVVRFPQPGMFSVYISTGDDTYNCFLNVTGAPQGSYTAAASTAKLTVDGKAVECEAYELSGNNFFKLRDIAAALNGTEKQFSVEYDAASQSVLLVGGKAYTPNGTELKPGDGRDKPAKFTAGTVNVQHSWLGGSLNGVEIADSNYFRLRDLGEKLNFRVGWDEATQTITVDTAKSYYGAD